MSQKEADNIEQSPADDAIVDSTPNEPTPENSGGNLTPTDDDKQATTSTLLESSCHRNRGNDPGTWQDLDNDDVAYWIDKGPSDCQHHDGPFDESRRRFPDERTKTRFCSKSMFYHKMPNGETNIREWLKYSPSTGSLYCFVHKLMAPRPHSSRFAAQGFGNWRNPVDCRHRTTREESCSQRRNTVSTLH